MERLNFFDKLFFGLVIAGALNWGLVGFLNFNLVTFLFGDYAYLTRFIYIVVGLSAVYLIFALKRICKK
ncbi:MAG: DUF378 domain-containing protein [Candidatus Magasanikbacteria bacterium CG_4_9_14_3_um_filter_32_9]|uniref:DUF378 domain-containing protein n=1 Tax=Candidatus Magasanikbacteria bacterium CG_4_9_14_3_um_filter_32_9 TaxID=1974644 RepID=A0A2M7Z7P0_9BACT|nr:MAG: DUF378 domain-containing protein [Candidatus Magasanikbacteria bacterium CG_4_9_14_3_um_filter_32_9]